MKSQAVVNPLSAYVTVSDYRLMVDDSGQRIQIGYDMCEFLSGGVITRGDLVSLVAPSGASVKPNIVSKTTAFFVATRGVAEKSGVAGDVIPVCTGGLTFVNVNAGTPAANQYAIQDGTTAVAGVRTTEVDATVITGTVVGMYMGAKSSGGLVPANLAPVYYIQY